MPIDKEIVYGRIEKIRACLVDLKDLAKLSLRDFTKNYKNVAAAERLLQISIEAMLDIGSHIIAEKGFEAPQEYRDVFVILAKRGLFDNEFLNSLSKMVGLRNKLVHVYMEVDPEKIHQFINDDLDDFEKYIKIVVNYIDIA